MRSAYPASAIKFLTRCRIRRQLITADANDISTINAPRCEENASERTTAETYVSGALMRNFRFRSCRWLLDCNLSLSGMLSGSFLVPRGIAGSPSTVVSFSRETLAARKSPHARDAGESGGAKRREGEGERQKRRFHARHHYLGHCSALMRR